MTEEWRSVKGYEGFYVVSNEGRVRALSRLVINNGGLQRKHERILIPHIDERGYCHVTLCKNGKPHVVLVHRLVATAFIDNPDNKPNIDHVDANPSNNCVENLRWVTQKENCLNPISRKRQSIAKMGHRGYLAHHSEETKRKISEARKGIHFSDAHRTHLSEAHKKMRVSNETKEVKEYGIEKSLV